MNQYNPNKHHRKSIRLKGYDYSQAGLYFITICCQNRGHLFGNVINKQMILNDAGKMIENQWQKLPDRFKNVELHEYVVMPNHFHGVLQIVGATLVVAQNENMVAQNENMVAQNENMVAQNENVVAQNENMVAQNENMVAQNENVVAQNENMVAQNTNNENTNIHVVDIVNQKGQPQGIAPTETEKTVGDIIGAFKSITTVEYINGVKNNNWKPFNGKLWQRNYWENIIRNDNSYQKISEYIINNPSKWNDDTFYSE
jgi:REP element-mobilizing transposase RayT